MTKKVVEFPKTPEERKALLKAKRDQEKQKLINIFGQSLFHTPDGIAYADLIVDSCRQTWAVRSKQFRHAFLRFVAAETNRLQAENPLMALVMGALTSKRRVNEAIDDFEMKALASTTEREVHLRVADDNDETYIDLCDHDWNAIRVTQVSWQVVQSPPVRFRRARGMRELPFPESGTPITELRRFLNLRDDNDFVLVVAFILAALRNQGPYSILVLTGEQGTAKSTFARIVRSLIDP